VLVTINNIIRLRYDKLTNRGG